jgi:plasmid rolling circle replication initiator protein Rep
MDVIGNKYAYLFLTLTVPNCAPEKLSQAITDVQKAWRVLIRHKRFKGAVRGFFKAIEVTRNANTNTYHPHLHVVLAVNKRYFTDDRYISRDEWLSMWQKATKDDSITQVDIRRAKSKKNADGEQAVKALSSAVAEIAKYAVKSADYLINDDTRLTDEIVGVLVPALANRRLCSFGGVFEDVRKQLQLDDCEDGDLIHLDGEINSDLAIQIYRYGWSAGAYKLLEVKEKAEI